MKTNESVINPSIALLTKHGKQDIIRPIMTAAFNTELIHTDKFDTDSLGSFDHKILRKLSPRECALKKAYLSCELTACQQGIGSEGSVNSVFGLGMVDEELIAFVDIDREIEIVASAKQAVSLSIIEATDSKNLRAQLAKTETGQLWLLKQGEQYIKGLSAKQLALRIERWPAIIEPDFRSMNCPQRQHVIALATQDLVRRLTAKCPECNMLNYVLKTRTGDTQYLPCELCSLPTSKVYPPNKWCERCGHSEPIETQTTYASAFYCRFCNP